MITCIDSRTSVMLTVIMFYTGVRIWAARSTILRHGPTSTPPALGTKV